MLNPARRSSRGFRRSSARPLIVEFTGLPGAGKTTIADRLRTELLRRGWRSPTTKELLGGYIDTGHLTWYIDRVRRPRRPRQYKKQFFEERVTPYLLWRFRIRHRRAWRHYRLAADALSGHPPEHRDRIETWVLKSVRIVEMLRRCRVDADIFVWGEGIAHRSVNLFADPAGPVAVEPLRAFLGAWPFPDVLVHVKASTGACGQRLRSRRLPERLEGASEDDVQRFLESCGVVVEAIVDEARRRGLPLLEVDNDVDDPDRGPGEREAQMLAEQVEREAMSDE